MINLFYITIVNSITNYELIGDKDKNYNPTIDNHRLKSKDLQEHALKTRYLLSRFQRFINKIFHYFITLQTESLVIELTM